MKLSSQSFFISFRRFFSRTHDIIRTLHILMPLLGRLCGGKECRWYKHFGIFYWIVPQMRFTPKRWWWMKLTVFHRLLVCLCDNSNNVWYEHIFFSFLALFLWILYWSTKKGLFAYTCWTNIIQNHQNKYEPTE